MKNVTITLEDDVAKWARILAARNDTSVSRFVGEMLKERMVREETYQSAQRRFTGRRPTKMRITSKPLPDRDEIHDRSGIR